MESDLITTAVGPLWSNNGTRTWSLLLGSDTIIVFPYTFFESLQLGLRIQLKIWPRDPGEAFRGRVREGMSEADLPRDRVLRRYHAHLLRSIVIRSNGTANTITFEKLSGEADEYAIALREETDDYRVTLGELYPGRYREKDFPTSAIGRLLRK
jgi:hypothetical protein